MIDDRVNNLTMYKWELYVYLHATRVNAYLCGDKTQN